MNTIEITLAIIGAFAAGYGAMARIDPGKNSFSIEEAGCSTRS
jgi:hypothetical protein